MNKQILLIILLLLNSIIVFIPVDIVRGDPNPAGGTIDGDVVWWENSYARLEVFPHTSTNIVRQLQYANLTWKESDNIIDVAFRFDDALNYGKIWKWNGTSWNQITMSHTTYNGKHYYYYDGFNVVQDTTYLFKWEYDTIANTSGKWWLFAKLNQHTIQQALDNDWYVALDPWWSSSWAYMTQFFINYNYIDSALTNFPVLINISGAISASCDGGNSLRFLHGSGAGENITEYDYEIDGTFDSNSYNFVWVNITSLSNSAFTVVNMYYDNPGASAGEDSSKVWNGDYLGVYHLNESSGSIVYNSGFRDFNATYNGGDLPTPTSGVIGDGQNFDGNDDYIDMPSGMFVADDTMTFEVWISGTTYSGTRQIYTLYETVDERCHFYTTNEDPYLAGYDNGVAELYLNGVTLSLSPNVETYMAVAYTDNDGAMWRDFNEILTDGVFALSFTPTVFRVGSNQDLNFDFIGLMDEIRISRTRRTDAWLKASYHTMNQTQNDSIDDFIIWGITLNEGIVTNGTTNINTTSAQLNGFISGAFDGNYNYGFWVSTSSPVSESATGFINYTGGGTVSAGNSTIVAAVGLTPTTHYYVRAWAYNASVFRIGNESSFYTFPPFPVTNELGSYNDATGNLEITWTKGVNSDNTLIRYSNSSYPTSVTDGVLLYNSTGESTTNSLSGITKYYTMWANTDAYYSTPVFLDYGTLIVNCYDEETNESLEFDILISNPDGSQAYQSVNNTNSLVINVEDNLPVGDDIRITVSASSNTSSKSEVSSWDWTENQTITYIVLSQTVNSKSTTNVTCINGSDDAHSYPAFTVDGDLVTILPNDADAFTRIYVNYSHDEYSSRLYYRDLDASEVSILNAYLPPTEDKQLYLLEVRDEAINTVSDAYIEVKRLVNGTFVVVSILLTDANGQADINLIINGDYIFIISKDGYVTENASWTPGTEIFTHTFKIVTEIIPLEPDTFGDIIDFYGTLFVNNTLRVTFYDLDNAMIDSHFIIYENYDGTLTYMGEYYGVTSNDIVFWINVDNATRLHTVVLFMNHSTLGEVINHRIVVYPVHIDREGGTWLENLISSVVGDWDYGYVITLIWVFPCVLLIAGLASIGHPGTGILSAGLYSAWLTWNITLTDEAKIFTFASIAIITGFITFFLVKGKKVVH